MNQRQTSGSDSNPVIYVEINGKRFRVNSDNTPTEPNMGNTQNTFLESLINIKYALDKELHKFKRTEISESIERLETQYTEQNIELDHNLEPPEERVEQVEFEPVSRPKPTPEDTILPINIRYVNNSSICGVLQNKRGEVYLTEVDTLVMITKKFSSPSAAAGAVAAALGQTIDSHSGWSAWEYMNEQTNTFERIGTLKRTQFKKPRSTT